jgi:RHS repeat-associated protein
LVGHRARCAAFQMHDLNGKRFAKSPFIGNIAFHDNGATGMTTTATNPVWLGITNVAVLAVDASNYVASIETGHAFVPKTPETFTYDADGNLLSDGRWNYTWDAENRLVKVESRSDTPQASWRRVERQYDAMSRRLRQTTSDGSSGTWVVTEDLKFVSDPVLFGRHVAELRASDNALVRSYVWGLDLSGTTDGAGGVGGLLWVTLHTASGPAAGTHYAAYDGNGNIVALLAASDGSETARYEYGPFGEPIRVTGPAAALNPFRFSTKRTDPTTDLVLYEFRPYDPDEGRFLSKDPYNDLDKLEMLDLSQYDRDSLARGFEPMTERNPYNFVNNYPLGQIDILGLISPVDPETCQPEPYNPPSLGKPCCRCGERSRCSIKAHPKDSGSSSKAFKIRLNLEKYGCCPDVRIRWTTCYRTDGKFGVLPECNDREECIWRHGSRPGKYGVWILGIFIDYLTCKDGTFQAQRLMLGLLCREEYGFPRNRWICD